ncbi:MAG: hypothetical protein KGH98_04690, partial [Candidatus Micrarchaeota archaeon]|nr:hypothetical protein [Candidatus Micrarchaeota archaeon]
MDTHTPIAYLALAGLFAIVSLSMHATTAATTNTVTANVNVFCPFAVTLNALPVYARVGNYIFNYSIESLASCSISSLGGDFTLTYTSNGAVLLTDPITIGTVTQTNTLYYTSPVNTLALPSGNYVAEVAFSNSFESNSSSKNIELLDPVNITVENFSTSSSVTQDGPITFDVGLKNVGEFASGTIGINMLIVGPQVYRISQSAGALSPSQGEVVAITLTTVTSTVGSYNALVNATYLSNSVVEVSNNMTTTFSVSSPAAPSGGGGPPVKKPANVITPVSGVSFTSMPLYTSLSQGSTSTGVFGFLNTGNQAEFVNVSVSNSLLGYVSFSSNTVYLQPG